MKHLTAPELAARLADTTRPAPLLLDVREPWELATCALPGALSMPMRSIPARIDELTDTAEIVCICHHGARSLQVAHFLAQHGFVDVSNLTGGVHAWAQQVDPTMPVY